MQTRTPVPTPTLKSHNASPRAPRELQSALRDREELRFHVELAQLGNTAGQLQVCLHALQDAHMRESDLADEF